MATAVSPSRPPRSQRPRRRDLVWGVALLALHAAAIWLFFGLYLPYERTWHESIWRDRLSALADDRRSTIEGWIDERLADGAALAGLPIVRGLASGDPVAAAAQTEVTALLDGVASEHRYHGAFVIARDGQVRAESLGSLPLGPKCMESVGRALASGLPAFAPHSHSDGRPMVVVVVPVLTVAEGDAGSPARVLGAVALAADPADWLYPLISIVPFPTATAETVLARADGGELQYLSPLRHDASSPLEARRPLASPGLAMREAVHGVDGFGVFRDYRGVEIFAATRRLRNVPWGLVAKVDRSEAMAAYRDEVGSAGLAAGALYLAVVTVAIGLWRRQRTRSQLDLTRAQASLAGVFEQANDAFFFCDLDGRIRHANRQAREQYGYSETELSCMTVADLHPPERRDELLALLVSIADRGSLIFRLPARRRDGTTFPVEVSARLVEHEGGQAILGVSRDLSERAAAEARIQRLNTLLRTISEVNQLIVRERDREPLLEQTCRILVEQAGFRSAWIAFGEEEVGPLRPAAYVGPDGSSTGAGAWPLDEAGRPGGLAREALRTRQLQIVDDWEAEIATGSWDGTARTLGVRTTAALPLEVTSGPRAVLVVHANLPGTFDVEFVALLSELAGDLAFALDALDARARRDVAERELRVSEERYRGLFEHMLHGFALCRMVYVDGVPRNFKYLEVNARFEELTGLHDVVGKWVSEVIPGIRDSNPELFEVYGRVASTGRPEQFETLVPGLGIWFQVSVYSPERGLFAAVFDNVTERKRAEADLRGSEERFRLLFHQAAVGIARVDADGRLLEVNDELCEILAAPREQLLQRSLAEITHPEDVERERAGIDRLLARELPVFRLEKRCLRPGGTDVWVRATSSLPPSQDGTAPWWICVVQEITEERRAAWEREVTIGLLRLVNEHDTTDDLVRAAVLFLKDQSGCDAVGIRLQQGEDFPYREARGFPPSFVRAEARLCSHDAGGNLARDHAGHPVLDCMCGTVICGRVDPTKPFFTPHGSFWTNSTTELLATTTEADRQGRTRNRCNGEGYESVALLPLRLGERALGLVQLNDRHRGRFSLATIALLERLSDHLAVGLARLEAEARLRQLAAELEDRVRERTAEIEAFSYSVSHDLRAPLRAIDGFSRLLADQSGAQLDDEGQRLIGVVRDNARRMGLLIDDLLTLSRAGRGEIRKEVVDQAELVFSVFTELVAAEKRDRIELVIGELPPAEVDPGLFRQVWTNLLANAIKFTGRCERPRIEVTGRRDGEKLEYQVRDNGVGFDMQFADKLFGVFQRLHGQAEFPGTGLGLALVQRIVRRHGGSVWAEAKPDQGAMFYVSLPARGSDQVGT